MVVSDRSTILVLRGPVYRSAVVYAQTWRGRHTFCHNIDQGSLGSPLLGILFAHAFLCFYCVVESTIASYIQDVTQLGLGESQPIRFAC